MIREIWYEVSRFVLRIVLTVFYRKLSISGLDKVSVVDYATGQVVAEVPVGNHPQRVRNGQLRLK